MKNKTLSDIQARLDIFLKEEADALRELEKIDAANEEWEKGYESYRKVLVAGGKKSEEDLMVWDQRHLDGNQKRKKKRSEVKELFNNACAQVLKAKKELEECKKLQRRHRALQRATANFGNEFGALFGEWAPEMAERVGLKVRKTNGDLDGTVSASCLLKQLAYNSFYFMDHLQPRDEKEVIKKFSKR